MLLRSSPHKKENGFTIVEVLVVILIIGILAAIAVPLYLAQRKSAYEAVLRTDLYNIGSQVAAEHDLDRDFFLEPFPVKNLNEENPDPARYTPVILSEGVRIEYQGTSEGFCILGLHQENSSNVWGFSSAMGGVTKDIAGCMTGTSTPGGPGPDPDPITDPDDKEVTGDLETDPTLPGKCFPELIGVTRYLNEYVVLETPYAMMPWVAYDQVSGYRTSSMYNTYRNRPDTVAKLDLYYNRLSPLENYIWDTPHLDEQYTARNTEMYVRYDYFREIEMRNWYEGVIADEIRAGVDPRGQPTQKMIDAHETFVKYLHQWNYVQCGEYAYPGHPTHRDDKGYLPSEVTTWPM